MEISGKAGGAIIGAIVVVIAIVGYMFFTRPPGVATASQQAMYDKMYKARMSGGAPSSNPGSQGGQGGRTAPVAP